MCKSPAPPMWPGAAALVAVLVAQDSVEASQWDGRQETGGFF